MTAAPLAVDPLLVTLELVRVEEAADPSAFRRGVQEYLLRSDDGTYAPATLRWDDDLMAALARARERAPGAAQALGELLRRFLAVTRLAALEARIEAALKDRRPVRVELASNAAELYALPWELLTLAGGRHLGELPGVEVVYRWPGARPEPDLRPPTREGGRLLLAWSRAHGNVGESYLVDAVDGLMRAHQAGFDRARDVVPDASLPAITAALAAGEPPTLLVLLCHGAPAGAGYGLGLDDGRGGRVVVDGGALRRALAPFAGHLRAVLLLACDGGNPGDLGAQLGSVAHELHRGGLAAVVAPRYPVTGAAALALAQDVLEAMLRETWPFERAFQAARERALLRGSADFAAFQLYAHDRAGARPFTVRPYRGLLAFEREHAALFFGRDAELAEALHDLDALLAAARPRLLVVAGASGTGKSSLVLAPLRVALEARGDHVAVLRPGAAPRDALAAALRGRPQGRRTILVVDQFEEVFTHGLDRDRPEGALAFVRDLWAMVSRTDDDLAAILTLRVDFAGRCGELPLDDAGARLDRVVYDEAHRVFVPQMGPDALRAVVERPAERAGLRLEPGLAERLIREVSGESNALPLLSYVLDELWRRRAGDLLTHAALDATGGVIGALARHADAVVDALDAPGQQQARRILVRLVTFGSDRSAGARRREEVAQLRSQGSPEAWDRAAAALIDARLVVRRGDAGPTLEIAHEALIRHWDRLWTWYQADRDRLARHHELGRLLEQYGRDGALNAKALAYGQELVAGLDPDDVVPAAWQMLTTSAARARRQQRLVRGLLAAALLVLTAFSTVTLLLYSRSKNNADKARQAEKDAKASARVAAASRLIDARPHVAAALLAARNEDRDPGFGWHQATFQTLQEPLPTIWQLPPAPATADATLAFTAAGDLLVGDGDGSLRLLPADGGPVRDLAPAGIQDFRVSAAGDLVVARTGPKTLRAYALGPAGLTPRADLTSPDDIDAFHLGGANGLVLIETSTWSTPPGAVVPDRTEQQTAWALAGAAFERRHARPRCDDQDAPAERSLCRAGDDAVELVAWTGEPLGRVDSPAIGRASRNHDALLLDYGDGDLVVWSWPAGQLPRDRRVVPRALADQGNPEILATPTRTVVFSNSGQGDWRGRVCSLPVAGTAAPLCHELDADCSFGATFDQAVILCPAEVRFLTAESLGLARRLRGLDAPAGTPLIHPRGHVALLDAARRVWRWRAQDMASGLAVLDRPWIFVEQSEYVPHLQPLQGRVAGLAWSPDDVVLELWPLRRDDLPRLPPPLTARVALPGWQGQSSTVVTRDAVLGVVNAPTGPALVVFTPREQRIDHRVLPLPPEADGHLRNATPDGNAAFMTGNAGLLRLDLRGDAVVVRPVPKGDKVLHVRDLDADGATLVVDDSNEFEAPVRILDAATGDPLVRAGALADATFTIGAFSPDGRALALGRPGGELVLADLAGRTLVPRLTLARHRATVTALAFSKDGQTLVSADASGRIVVWRGLVDSAWATVSVEVPGEVWQVGLSPDDATLWALDRHGALRYWTLFDPDALPGELARRASHCLAARDWIELLGATEDEADALARKSCARR